MLTRPAYVMSVAVVIAFLLAASVTRQYWWVTELSDLRQDRADRALRLSGQGFVRQLDREVEQLWYTLHVRSGFQPEHEIAADYRRWRESAAHPDLVRAVYWAARTDVGEVAAAADPPRRFTFEAINLEEGALEPLVPDEAMGAFLDQLSEPRPRRRRRGFGPDDGFVATLAPSRFAFVVPQPSMDDRAWAVAEFSTPVLRQGLLGGLVRDHFGAASEREYDVRVFRPDVSERPLFATDAVDGDGTWDAPDFVGRETYFTVAVRHREGSIPIAAANVRRANLLFTFGTVVVLLMGLSALAVATSRAQRLVNRQTEFVAGVSHELRTPISGISVLGQNLADGVVKDPAQAAAYGRSIQIETRRLSSMVEGVLQLSAIRTGGYQYEFKALDVRSVIAACIEDLEPEERACVEMALPAHPLWCVADERALRMSVRNLVLNALKFGGATPRVHLTVGAGTHRGNAVVLIQVRDEGAGIDPRDQRHVFEAFYRGRNAHDNQTPGSGLGLSVVRRVATAHGGAAWVESEPGQGSVFTLALPVAAERRAAPGVPGDA